MRVLVAGDRGYIGAIPSKSVRSPVHPPAPGTVPVGHPQLPRRLQQDLYEGAGLQPAADGPAGSRRSGRIRTTRG